ncbi:BQ2448_5415 [Microbotryum intermedium]|uniref:BQ2448_5415 protein n=1 Tax=Microbotryum intermedium TaxID=269621 RepID=A0A238F7G0_9BASI|nr:BQ2448_5415 [Microbotryum intermedium]
MAPTPAQCACTPTIAPSPSPSSSGSSTAFSGSHASESTTVAGHRPATDDLARDEDTDHDNGPEFSSLEPVRSLDIPPTEGMLAQLSKPLKRHRQRQRRAPCCEAQSKSAAAAARDTDSGINVGPCESLDDCEKAVSKEDEFEVVERTYPDGGSRAWSVVFGCWVFASSQLAFGMTWGVLVEDLSRNHYPHLSLATLNGVMGIAAFLMNGFAFISGRLGDKFGYRPIIAIGSVLYIIALVASALSVDRLPLLFLFLGVGVGIAVGCTFPLVCALPSQWFLKRRGFASGIAVSGTGLGGAMASLIMRSLLPRLVSLNSERLLCVEDMSLTSAGRNVRLLTIPQGFKKMLLVYAGINAFTTAAAFPLLRTCEPPRLPGQPRAAKNWLPKGVWKDGTFYSFIACVFVGIFGYLVPYAFLVTYTVKIVPNLGTGLKPAAPLIVANAASGIGRICAGLVADRAGPVNMLFASWFFGGLLQLLFWPRATSFDAIMVFSALYGFTGAWFVSLLPMAAAQLFGMEGLSTIVGFMILVNAPGQLGGGPIGGLVLTAAGGDYKATCVLQPVAYFGGGTMMLGSIVLLYARFAREHRILAKF